MAQHQGLAVFKELVGLLATAVTNRKAARGFEITPDLAFADFNIQNADTGKIQQLLNGNGIGHDFALPDNCGFVTTISWGISRPLTKTQNNYAGIKVFEGSVYDDLSERYGLFPMVISIEVIEHCYDPRKFMRAIYELLEPDGVVIISTPYHAGQTHYKC